MRYFHCHCCTAMFTSRKKQSPQRDRGWGTCIQCQPLVAASMARDCTFPGVTDYPSAIKHLNRYA